MHQAEVIHQVRLTPKEAWKSVKILTGGGLKIHHATPTVMQLRLTDGNLATTDAEKISMMRPHLTSVYQKHRPITWEVLNDIEQRNMMSSLDIPISWDKLKK